MPAKDGLRLNDLSRTKQARPEPGHPDQQGPVTAAQSKTRRCTPQGDAKLMAKEQVLRFKPARRLEEVDDEHCERMQEREHRPRSCDDSTRRCDSQAGRDFRKGQRQRKETEADPSLRKAQTTENSWSKMDQIRKVVAADYNKGDEVAPDPCTARAAARVPFSNTLRSFGMVNSESGRRSCSACSCG